MENGECIMYNGDCKMERRRCLKDRGGLVKKLADR